MTHTITHFMCGYQIHFRTRLETESKSLYQLLDERLSPEIFLVGILVDNVGNQFPACVEPEVDFWAKSEDFVSALSMAAPIAADYPESKLFHSDPTAQEHQRNGLHRRSIKDAILSIVRDSPQSVA